MIEKKDLLRAFEVNDALVQERRERDDRFQPQTLQDLDINIDGLAAFAAEYSVSKEEVSKRHVVGAVALSFSMGALTALRARKLVDSG